MFKLIKRIIKLAILIIVLAPVIMLIVMYKGYSAPVEDFQAHESLSFNDIASNKLDEFLEDDTNETFDFVLTDKEANAALKSIYASGNEHFGSTDLGIPEHQRKYAMEFGTGNGGFKGVTVRFNETGMSVEAGVDAGFSGIFYQTTLYLDLDIKIEQVTIDDELQTQYKLVIKDIKLGNMPILWMYDFANWGVGLFADGGLSGMIQNAVSGFGNFDLNTKSIWLNSEDIINLLGDENDPNRPMLEALLGFIDEEALLVSGFGTDVGGISLALGQMRSTKTSYQTSHQIQDENDMNDMFQAQLSSVMLSALQGGTNLYYDMHEEAFNQLIEYYVGDSMDITQTFEFGPNVYVMETLPLYGKFVDNKVHFTIIMHLYNEAEPTKIFKTDFTLVATPSLSADKQDLVFTIDVIHIGDDTTVSNDKVVTILSLVGDVEMIQGNQIILEDFMGNFANSQMTVSNVAVHNAYLRFTLSPDSSLQSALNALQNEIDDALDTVFLNPQFSDLNDVYQNDPEDIEGLLDVLNQMDPVTQAAFYNSLYTTLNAEVDIDDLLP